MSPAVLVKVYAVAAAVLAVWAVAALVAGGRLGWGQALFLGLAVLGYAAKAWDVRYRMRHARRRR